MVFRTSSCSRISCTFIWMEPKADLGRELLLALVDTDTELAELLLKTGVLLQDMCNDLILLLYWWRSCWTLLNRMRKLRLRRRRRRMSYATERARKLFHCCA